MFHVIEYDEDPALLQQQKEDNAPVPRYEYKIDLSSTSSSSSSAALTTVAVQSATSSSWHRFWHTPKQVLFDLFLPLGFPHSVDSSYLAYQFYDSLQGLCSYLRGVVSTSAVLTAAGVGNADATAMGAAMTWALKDGMGMVGGLVFSYYASPHFDANVKEFRLFADLINDVALTLDMMAPLVPSSCLLGIMSLSTLSKTMCGMSAGATKSSITVHLAREGNMADLNAKEGTQETLVSLLGMLLGVQLAKQLEKLEQFYHQEPLTLSGLIPQQWQVVPVDLAVSWATFLFMTWLHMWANYRGVKLLKLETLNRERSTEVLGELTNEMARHTCGNESTSASFDLQKHVFPGPHDVDESMVRATLNLLFPQQQGVALGVSLFDILQSTVFPKDLLQQFDQERYILCVVQNARRPKVMATLRSGAQKRDELKAFIHSMLLHKCLTLDNSSKQKDALPSDKMKLIQKTHSQVDALFGTAGSRNCLLIHKLAEKGWDVDGRLYIGFGRKRTSWESTKID